jgi:hypothetical protein
MADSLPLPLGLSCQLTELCAPDIKLPISLLSDSQQIFVCVDEMARLQNDVAPTEGVKVNLSTCYFVKPFINLFKMILSDLSNT